MGAGWVFPIVAFVVLLALVVFVRNRYGGSVEIKNPDVVLALVPVALYLFLSGQVKELAFGDFKISRAIQEAANATIEKQVTPLPVSEIREGRKSAANQLEKRVSEKTQALTFELGKDSYNGGVIFRYLARLTDFPFFKYVVIKDASGRFVGLFDPRVLLGLFKENAAAADDFAGILNAGNKEALASITGFVPSEKAISRSTDKVQALNRMDELDQQVLPVVSQDGSLVGVVERSKLTASIISDISRRVAK